MYVLIVSDAPALPVDLCIASAMLGHPAWAFRPEELRSANITRPALVLLDLEESSAVSGSIAAVRERYQDVAIALVAGDPDSAGSSEEDVLHLAKPVTAAALREVMQRARQVAA